MDVTEQHWKYLESLCKNAKPLNASYKLSYSTFVKFFAEKDRLTSQDIIVGANFSYGWMPTILNIHSSELSEQTQILNRLKIEDIIPTEKELELLKSTFNRSIVGTSKLMHFISPTLIPIWDSKVHKRLKEILKLNYQTNTIKNFTKYLSFCQSIINDKKFSELKSKSSNNYDSSISNMRAVEQILFLAA